MSKQIQQQYSNKNKHQINLIINNNNQFSNQPNKNSLGIQLCCLQPYTCTTIFLTFFGNQALFVNVRKVNLYCPSHIYHPMTHVYIFWSISKDSVHISKYHAYSPMSPTYTCHKTKLVYHITYSSSFTSVQISCVITKHSNQERMIKLHLSSNDLLALHMVMLIF